MFFTSILEKEEILRISKVAMNRSDYAIAFHCERLFLLWKVWTLEPLQEEVLLFAGTKTLNYLIVRLTVAKFKEETLRKGFLSTKFLDKRLSIKKIAEKNQTKQNQKQKKKIEETVKLQRRYSVFCNNLFIIGYICNQPVQLDSFISEFHPKRNVVEYDLACRDG